MCVCTCGGDPRVTHAHFDRVHCIETTPVDLGTFQPLPALVFERLIVKGRQDARELDDAIRGSFEMQPEDNLLLR